MSVSDLHRAGVRATGDICAGPPNLFVIGAPKCGTTSLCDYLAQHPEIYFPRTKEPLYFCADQDHRAWWQVRDAERYLELFRPGADRRWRGDGSTWYLMSSVAAQRIQAYNPDARIVAVLRNPVDLAASLHAQFLFSGNESIRDFGRAYAAQKARAEGRRIPWRAHAPHGLVYTEVGRYANQVERLFDAFPRHQVRVLVFEELFADLPAGYRQLLDFLKVDAGFRPDFALRNERHQVRSAALQRLLVKAPELWNLPHRLPRGGLRDRLAQRFDRANAALRAFNGGGRRPPPLSPAMRRRLHADFADDIARLEMLLDRDLAIWTRRNTDS